MNMTLHGVEDAEIAYRDSLAEDHAEDAGAYSLVLANPPFAGSLDYETTAKDLLKIVKTKKTELLFVALRRFVDLGVMVGAQQNQVIVDVGTATQHAAPPCRLPGDDVRHLAQHRRIPAEKCDTIGPAIRSGAPPGSEAPKLLYVRIGDRHRYVAECWRS
jgi:hypothetical protein